MNIRKIGFFIILILVLTACQQGANEKLEQSKQDENNRFYQTNYANPNVEEKRSNSEIATHLADVASRVPEVNQASALVAGPYTVIAIDVKEDIDRSRVGSIKYTVSEALYHDPYGKTAVVIADGDIMARIQSMNDKIQQGHPVQGIVDELAAIVGRYMPEFPVNDDQPIEPDSNKEMLPEDEKEQLEDIEKEQSNDVKQD